MAYISAHNPASLSHYSTRTPQNSAAYLLPYLQPSSSILDVGCGPGSITLGFASLVPDGSVVGLDTSEELMERNTQNAREKGMRNVSFVVGDIYSLPFADATFTITHIHQVLCHLTDPLRALRELRRVTRPGGLIAARESIMETMVAYPSSRGLEAWKEAMQRMHAGRGQHPGAGKALRAWALEIGFEADKLMCSAGTFCYSGKEEREWWGGVWAARCVSDEWKEGMKGIADEQQLQAFATAWNEWSEKEEAWFGMMHGELLAWV
ncbi:hypothetical protein NCC49_002609 [Naganishia albida]|nr:hypothetical protein NCC49_002609 [Naganishia albida]